MERTPSSSQSGSWTAADADTADADTANADTPEESDSGAGRARTTSAPRRISFRGAPTRRATGVTTVR